MPATTSDDVLRMRDQLFFEGPDQGRKLSRFWLLLVLAGVIATGGVVADSTATVIGAMIVAPLMTPILGIVLGLVLGDRVNLVRSVVLVAAGAAVVVLVAWLMGHLVAESVVSAFNSQVATRVQPRLIDLISALATGAVGSVALARSDISDTLPGVAIAISLVPPLAVVGLTLESGAPDQAAGALLLFGTNVAAILLSGVVVMAVYRTARLAGASAAGADRSRRRAIAVISVAVVAVAVPLSVTSRSLARQSVTEQQLQDVLVPWARQGGWRLLEVSTDSGVYVARVGGSEPAPDISALRRRLGTAGLADERVRLELAPEQLVQLGPD